MTEHISNEELQMTDVPPTDAPIDAILSFALSFDGYADGGFEQCAKTANQRLHGNLTETRTCLFFEHRRFRHFGEMPQGEEEEYIRLLVTKIAEYVGQRESADIHSSNTSIEEYCEAQTIKPWILTLLTVTVSLVVWRVLLITEGKLSGTSTGILMFSPFVMGYCFYALIWMPIETTVCDKVNRTVKIIKTSRWKTNIKNIYYHEVLKVQIGEEDYGGLSNFYIEVLLNDNTRIHLFKSFYSGRSSYNVAQKRYAKIIQCLS